jgi:ribulose-5-phosphate 4-epimerase/fuculose-1-phosphate aldolase
MIEQLIRYAHKVKQAGLVVSSSGNISTRIHKNRFAISSSGAYLGNLTKDDITTCYLDDENKYDGPEPSIETPLHRAIYLMRPDIKAVLHFQSPYATTLACARTMDFDLNFIPEVPVYLKNIKVIPYANPGSQVLVDDINKNLLGHDSNIFILRGHGIIAIGQDLRTVLRNAEILEFACRIRCQGIQLNTYSPETIKELQNFNKA